MNLDLRKDFLFSEFWKAPVRTMLRKIFYLEYDGLLLQLGHRPLFPKDGVDDVQEGRPLEEDAVVLFEVVKEVIENKIGS